MRTRRVEVTLTVKEFEGGQPFIVMAPLGSGDPMPEIERKVVAFDLKPGMTLEEAQALAQTLRRSTMHFSVTDRI